MPIWSGLMGWKGYVGVAIIAAVAAGAGGWKVRGWLDDATIARMERNQAQIAQAQAEDHARQVAQVRGKELAAAQAYADIDTRMTATLKEKQDENDKLSAAVSAGTVRLRIAATCPVRGAGVPAPAGAARVDDGAAPELDAAARPAYNALRAGIEKQRQTILALQALLKEARLSGN